MSKKKTTELLKTISLFYKDHNDTIIETDCLHSSVWGELVAKELGYKHITYLLNESEAKNYILYPGIDYFLFKYERGELFGCSKKSLEIILNKHYKQKQNNYFNVAFDSNEIKELTFPSIKNLVLLKNSKTILTISRLEKGYVRHLIETTIDIAKDLPHININLIVAGGTIFKRVEDEFEKKYLPPETDLTNLNIKFTGYIEVMGKDLFNLSDLFVGMGTAAINAISQKCATVLVDPRTNKTPGVLGLHTTTFAYSDTGIDYDLKEMITRLLKNEELIKEAKNKGFQLYNSDFKIESSHAQYVELFSKSNNVLKYFDYNITFFRRCFDLVVYTLKKNRKKLL